MYWGIIHRMVLMELVKIFFMALIALTGIILLAGVISEAMKNDFGPAQILAIIPLLLPSLLPYTVPTTTLFAACIVYGRLSADNEILALKAAGTHIIHVVWPAVLLGVVTTVVTMICYFDVIPYTGSLLRNQVISDVEELMYMMLRKDGAIRHPNLSFEIHVRSVIGRKLQDAIFKRRTPGGFDLIARAKEAELRVDVPHKQILVHMRDCQIEQPDGAVAFVESQIWPVEVPEFFRDGTTKTRGMDMTWNELFEYQARSNEAKERTSRELDLLQTLALLGKARPGDEEQVRQLTAERRYHDNLLFAINAEFHMRPALSLSCLCFALVGCPIGIWFSKSDYLSAFITCFLPIVAFYYPLMFCMFDLSRAGRIPPWMGIYNADTLMLMAGGILFWRLARN